MKWINVNDRLPEKVGRYLVLQTFFEPMSCNNSIVRKHVPFCSNFTLEKGWMNQSKMGKITHWMTSPEPPKD